MACTWRPQRVRVSAIQPRPATTTITTTLVGILPNSSPPPTVKNALFLAPGGGVIGVRSEEHTSELQSQSNLVCRLLLEKKKTPLVPDHGHLMHVFLVRDSTLSGFAHLHPLPLDSTSFAAALPPVASGRSRVYADIIHESGFAETLVATVDLPPPAGPWRPSDRDDAC